MNLFISKEDKIELVKIYLNKNSLRETEKLFEEKNPGRENYPTFTAIGKIIEKFNKNGSLERKKVINKKKTAMTEGTKTYVLAEINNQPIQSSRGLGNKAGISHMTAWRALKKENFFAYKLRKVQPLYGKLIAIQLTKIFSLNKFTLID